MTYAAAFLGFCMLIVLAALTACFYFARQEAYGRAFAAFFVASSVFSAASKIVYDTMPPRVEQPAVKAP